MRERTARGMAAFARAFSRAMTIWNATRYPTCEVERLVRFGFGGRIPGWLLLWVRPAHECLSGMSYDYVPEHVDALRRTGGVRLVAILRVGARLRFPCSGRYPGVRGAPNYTVRCWREAVVVLAAHEAVHLRHFEGRRRARRRLARGRDERIPNDSELSCERASVRALRRFREGERCGEAAPGRGARPERQKAA